MATMNFYTEDEALDKVLGEKGAPLRNQYESDMNAFLIGEAIKKSSSIKESYPRRIRCVDRRKEVSSISY